MAEPKTKPTDASVADFLAAVPDERRRDECRAVARMMQRVTKKRPKMWGPSMVGFGTYHFKYASGREGDWFVTGFAPRKTNLTLYIMSGFKRYDTLMAKLGKHTTGSSCLYIKRLEDIDMKVLEQLVKASVAHVAKQYA